MRNDATAALGADPGPARRAALLRDFGAARARLHARPPPPDFGSREWLGNLLTGASRLNPRVNAAQVERLWNERPVPGATGLIHGYLFLENVMTQDGRVTGFIDWSFAEIGDARSDVAVATHDLTEPDREAFVEGTDRPRDSPLRRPRISWRSRCSSEPGHLGGVHRPNEPEGATHCVATGEQGAGFTG
ncbi:aminoglycoside phosphotransferase family protein [Deinococcus kurensis]|uniref:aminoglycoside phosphotransferase family protein n=1 Tax=Deinococcus kurensis TaxID=2662757 RepID=UPI001390B434